MSFKIDQNEPEELDYWCSQSYEVTRGAYNKTSGNSVAWPDITILSKKIIGVNRKQITEWMSGFSDWQTQVLWELNSPVDYLIQVIEGGIYDHPRDGLWGVNLQDIDITKQHKRGTDIETGGAIVNTYAHESQHDYKNLMGELIRLSDAGIPTFFTGSTFGTAKFLVELHSIADREDWEPRLLTRLVKEKYMISEREMGRRNLILFLMGVPGIGQSVATALVDWFGNFDDLYTVVSSGQSIANIPLGSKTSRSRTIGPAIDKKVKEFWGLRP